MVVFFLLLGGAINLQAQIVTYTWTGRGMDDNWFDDANWDVAPAPDSHLTANVIFGDTRKSYVNLYGNTVSYVINAYGLTFSGNSRPYYLDGNYDGYLTLHLGAGGVNYSPAQPVQSMIAADLELHASQTWNIASGTLVFDGNIYDGDSGYTFTKTGAGTLVFGNYDNEFYTSTLNLNNGRLVLASAYSYMNGPLGSTDLTIGPASTGINPVLVAKDSGYGYSVILDNNITLNGVLTTENNTELELTGPITLNADTTINTKGAPLVIGGSIDEATAGKKLTVNSTGTVILTGTNGYTGGTHVENGTLIFATVGSLPAAPATNALTSSASGYIGFGDDGTTNTGLSLTNPQGLFLDRFNKASTLGTVGFDTDPSLATTNDYTGSLDLTGFAPGTRLGSATHAILSGSITPQGTAYRFGGGGGFLQVNSQLADQITPTAAARSLVVDSPAAYPLTLRLTSAVNTYSGGTSVTNSALVFGTGLATGVPSGTRNITINAGGYVGFMAIDDMGDDLFVQQSLEKITTTSLGTVGYDGNLLLTVPINLGSFTNALYLGTSTWASLSGPGLTLSGSITTTNSGADPYRFAGYKGGALEVSSPLTGANGVLIGDPTSPGTFGDYLNQEYSKVALTGNNSGLSGNVTLYGGQLMVGQSNGTPGTDPTTALGWNTTTSTGGNLVVAGMTLPAEWQGDGGEPPAPRLAATTSGVIIPNNITLNTELNAGGDNNFTLAGNITGPGELYVGEDSFYGFTLSLTGNNTFSGGVYVASGTTVNAGSNTALGTGPIGFGYSGGTINFLTTAPVIGSLGIKEDNDYAYLYATQTNTVLTINQSVDGKYRGDFRSSATYPDDNFRVVKNGAGTLRLDGGGLYFYHGKAEAALPGTPEVNLQINQGTLVIGNYFYVEGSAPTIWVHGGTLAVDHNNYTLYNPLAVDNGGRLAGTGSFGTAVIGAGAVLSPGLAEFGDLGFLQFDHLELNAGGAYEWQIQDPDSLFGHDQIDVATPTTLVINATSANRFTLKVISLALNGTNGALTGFDPSIGYSWSLFNYDSLGGAFDPAAFAIDTSLFANSLAYDARGKGIFYLTATGSSLMLNFAPVPEPSTCVLLALGLGFFGLTLWRKRHV